jgi:hypothetical protein
MVESALKGRPDASGRSHGRAASRCRIYPAITSQLHLALTISKRKPLCKLVERTELCVVLSHVVAPYQLVENPAGAFCVRVQKAFFLCSNRETWTRHKSHLDLHICAVSEHRRFSLNVTSFPCLGEVPTPSAAANRAPRHHCASAVASQGPARGRRDNQRWFDRPPQACTRKESVRML